MTGVRRRARPLAIALAGALLVALAACSPQPAATGPVLRVHAGTVLRPVTHVAAGGLYALAAADRPSRPAMAPLRLRQLTQPPPGVQQLGNGATVPTGDALVVAQTVQALGAHEYVRMPDVYPDFPYRWVSWKDWTAKVDRMVDDLRAAPTPAVNGWEIWNEPDWTWDTVRAGPFEDGWTRTVRLVRAKDTATPIVGPSYSVYSDAAMATFLAAAKRAGTVPDVISWHELADGAAGWSDIAAHVRDYRALERGLGLKPRPISINEYAAKDAIDVPGSLVHFIAGFEASGVADAERAYWYESGTVGGLVTGDDRPTGTYWLYAWYGAMRGSMVRVAGQDALDGFAALDRTGGELAVVAGGAADGSVRVDGLTGFGDEVRVRIDRTSATGRHRVLAKAVRVSDDRLSVRDGVVTVPLPRHVAGDALRVLISR